MNRIWFFLTIVWRKWHVGRIGWSTAWEVSKIVTEEQ